MRTAIVAVAIAAVTIAASLPALSQMSGGGGFGSGGRGHHGQAKKADQPQRKKVDDKEYKAAIGRLPNKKYDPWGDKH